MMNSLVPITLTVATLLAGVSSTAGHNLEFSKLLPDVVTIADEVDAQLKEQMLRFMAADAAEHAKGK
jgi:hypothetical protein